MNINPSKRTSARWWYEQLPRIDLSPPYQRKGGIWSARDQAFLIDSMINGFDVPKLYLADFRASNSPLNTRGMPYAVIDGKQRLEALKLFLDNVLPLNRDFMFMEDPELELGGSCYSDLQKLVPRIAKRVDEFPLSVMLVEADENQIKQLFVRLNRSSPLTGAEVRNAMFGPIPEIIRQLAAHDFLVDRVTFNKKRGQDLNVVAKALVLQSQGRPTELKKRRLDAFVRDHEGSSLEDLLPLVHSVHGVLDKMCDVFRSADPLLSSQGMVTLYYWFIHDRMEDEPGRLRSFLQEFTRLRKTEKKEAARYPDRADKGFMMFESTNRNTNDPGSFGWRHEFLHTQYARFCSARPVLWEATTE